MTDRQQLELGFSAPEAPRAGRLRHHHVRSHETVDEAIAGEARAIRQEDVLVAWFEVQTYVLPSVRFTPSQVWKLLGEGLGWPLTSCRRACSNATRDGRLVHHPEDRRDGLYGAKEGTWSLADGTRNENATTELALHGRRDTQ
jgi:hypothetical protein